MDRKQIIAVAALAVGFLGWRMGAMQQEENILLITSDGQRVPISKKDADRFGTVSDLVENASESGEIPLKNVSAITLQRLFIDMGITQGAYEKTLANEVENLEAALYLSCSELIDVYAKEVADILASDASLELLQKQDAAFIAFIQSISLGAKVKIYPHISESEVWCDFGTRRHTGGITSGVFSLDSKKSLTVSDKMVVVGRENANNQWTFFAYKAETSIRSAMFSTDSSLAMVVADDKAQLIWHGDSGWVSSSMPGEIKVGAFSPDGNKFFQCDSNGDEVLYIKNTNTNWTGYRFLNGNGVRFAVFSPDSKNLYMIRENDSYLMLNNESKGDWEGAATFHTAFGAESAKFSPDSKMVISSFSRRASIILKDDANDRWMQGILDTDDEFVSAEFSPDSKIVALRQSNSVDIVWQVAQHYNIQYSIEHTARINAAIFSPDSKKIATASEDGTVKIALSVNDPNGEAHIIKHDGPVYSVAFSPDSKKVVTASGDKTAKIVWQDENNQWLEYIIHHDGPVNAAVFSPDGKKVVTASDDKTAKIVWQDKNGAWREDIIKHNAAIKSATFSPDSKKILVISSNNLATILNLIQANTFYEALFIRLLKWADARKLEIKREEWMQEAFETFKPGYLEALETDFKDVLIQ